MRPADTQLLKRLAIFFHVRSSGHLKGSAVGFSFVVRTCGLWTFSPFFDQQLEQKKRLQAALSSISQPRCSKSHHVDTPGKIAQWKQHRHSTFKAF